MPTAILNSLAPVIGRQLARVQHGPLPPKLRVVIQEALFEDVIEGYPERNRAVDVPRYRWVFSSLRFEANESRYGDADRICKLPLRHARLNAAARQLTDGFLQTAWVGWHRSLIGHAAL